jgi:hypothetical protein
MTWPNAFETSPSSSVRSSSAGTEVITPPLVLKRFENRAEIIGAANLCQPLTTARACLTIPVGLIGNARIETFHSLDFRQTRSPRTYLWTRSSDQPWSQDIGGPYRPLVSQAWIESLQNHLPAWV